MWAQKRECPHRSRAECPGHPGNLTGHQKWWTLGRKHWYLTSVGAPFKLLALDTYSFIVSLCHIPFDDTISFKKLHFQQLVQLKPVLWENACEKQLMRMEVPYLIPGFGTLGTLWHVHLTKN